MPKTRRILSILCLVVFLGLPLAAQSASGPEPPFPGFLSAFWERLTAPMSFLWEADETTTTDPTGTTTTTPPSPDTDTRGGWDPNG